LSHTRSSLLLCGVALINLLFDDEIDKKGLVINNMLFTFGMLIRPESGLGTLLLVSIGHLIYRFDLIHLIKRSFFPYAAAAIMVSIYFVDWSHSDLFLKKVEPEVEYKLMEKRVVDISVMRTKLDSIKYQAAVAGTCFDTRILTPDYFRSILLPGSDLSFKHALDRFYHVLSLYKYYLFIPFYSCALLLLCLFQRDRWKPLLKIIVFQVATFMIIYFVDYTGQLVCGRHFLNLEIISLLITSFFFFVNNTYVFSRQNRLVSIICMLFVLGAIRLCLTNYKNDSNAIADNTYCYEKTMGEIDSLYSNRIIILTTDNFHLFDHVFSIKNKKYDNNTYLMYDVWTYCLFPEYSNFLAKKCNCDPLDPVAFFNWLSSNNALYIAEPWRYDLTAKYMNIMHSQNLNFVPNSEYKKPECINDRDMGKFELRRVIVKY
jgi:hypothetical protein